MARTDLARRQLELIAELAELRPRLTFMGGFAEDAVLAVTRAHEDVDLVFPRSEQELRLTQLAELGCTGWETWGESAPGVGPLSKRHCATLAELRRRFFPDRRAQDFLPLREPLLAVDAAEVS